MAIPGSKGREPVSPVLGGILLALLCSGSGCAVLARQQADQPVAAEQVAKVEVGMTKSQVTDLLGTPQEIIYSNKEHDPLREHAYLFEYSVDKGTAIFFAVVNFGNLDKKRDRVMVFFDDNGRVQNVARSFNASRARYGFPFGR